jgi:hypothetical protein
VSHDLAFWDGPAPSDDDDATATFTRLCEALEDGGIGIPHTPAVAEFVADLERRWPDDEDPDSPWASMPIRGDAHGPFAYLAVRYGRPTEDVEFIVGAAQNHGLVCFDPQFSQLLR